VGVSGRTRRRRALLRPGAIALRIKASGDGRAVGRGSNRARARPIRVRGGSGATASWRAGRAVGALLPRGVRSRYPWVVLEGSVLGGRHRTKSAWGLEGVDRSSREAGATTAIRGVGMIGGVAGLGAAAGGPSQFVRAGGAIVVR